MESHILKPARVFNLHTHTNSIVCNLSDSWLMYPSLIFWVVSFCACEWKSNGPAGLRCTYDDVHACFWLISSAKPASTAPALVFTASQEDSLTPQTCPHTPLQIRLLSTSVYSPSSLDYIPPLRPGGYGEQNWRFWFSCCGQYGHPFQRDCPRLSSDALYTTHKLATLEFYSLVCKVVGSSCFSGLVQDS